MCARALRWHMCRACLKPAPGSRSGLRLGGGVRAGEWRFGACSAGLPGGKAERRAHFLVHVGFHLQSVLPAGLLRLALPEYASSTLTVAFVAARLAMLQRIEPLSSVWQCE
jgi:hypothetical protein